MRDRHDFDFGGGLTKHDNVGKPAKYLPASIESELRELSGMLLNVIQGRAKFDHQ